MARLPLVRSLQHFLDAQASGELSDAQLLQRFLDAREQDAFAVLVSRHGPLVWGVCRHLLGHEHDAEDAFQAAFLILARRASSIRKGEALSSWLHGVAYRVAMNAKKSTSRRKARERRVARREESAEPDLGWRELQTMLDEEVHRLPRKYREPFVLCCLEGRGRKEVAAEHGWKEGTLSFRIAEARRLLQERLTKRGVTLSAALTAGELWRQSAHAAPCADLMTRAITLGMGAEVAPASVATLATGLGTAWGRVAAGAAAVVLALAAAVGAWPEPLAATQDAPAAVAAPPAADPLPPEAVARLGTLRFRPGGWIQNLAFLPDGKQLVSTGSTGIRVWDAATGREVARLPTGKDRGMGAGFPSKDGNALVTLEWLVAGEGVIRFRHPTTLAILREFATGQWFQGPRLSPDGTLLAGYAHHDRKNYSLEIWDVKEGKKLRSWTAHADRIWDVDFSPDGKLLASGGGDKVIRFWDVQTGAKKAEIAAPTIVAKVAFSRDGKTLATLGARLLLSGGGGYYPPDDVIRLWDVATGKEQRQLKLPPRINTMTGDPVGFRMVQFAPDGKTLVSCGDDAVLRFWDVTTGTELRRHPLGLRGAAQVAFSPDGKTIAVGSQAIRLLDVATGKEIVKLEGHANGVSSVALTPDGRTVATAGDGTVALWDVASGRETGRLWDVAAMILSVQLLPGGKELLTLDLEKTLRVWNVATRAEVRCIPTKGLIPQLVVVSPNGKSAVMVTVDGKTLVTLDLTTGNEVGRARIPGQWVSGVAFRAHDENLVVWNDIHDVYVVDPKSGKIRNRFGFAECRPPARPGRSWRSGLAYVAAVSPTGRQIVYGGQPNFLAFHDLDTGKVVRMVSDLPSDVAMLTFSPDGRTLAWVNSHEPTIHLMEVASGKERHRFVGHKGRVTALTFSADGRTLVSGGDDTTALVWDLVGVQAAKGDLETCWADLADTDTAKAFRGMRRLIQSPAEAVALLGKRMQPVPESPSTEWLRLARSLEVLERIPMGQAREVLKKLAGGATGAWLTREAAEALARQAKR